LTADPVQWLFSLEHLGIKFGLENISRLLGALGNPHQTFASVHVAGTNGKGSVTAIVDTALRHAGYRSARYTSPHLERIEERFVIDGQEVESAALADAAGAVRDATSRLIAEGALAGPPTFFEATTAAAFELFNRAGVDIAVVEVGLGGRLDSTNVIRPVVCAITTIAFDHQALLGQTLAEIAAEKAGIIKPGVPIVIGRLSAESEAVIKDTADERGATVIRAHDIELGVDAMTPKLRGAHQRDNAIVALAVLDTLGRAGFPVAPEAARFGVENVSWPGRLEQMRMGGCTVLFDAAHNPAGAESLAHYLRETTWSDATLVFGAMADKDIRGMLDQLVPVVTRVICTTPESPRAATAQAVAEIVATFENHPDVEVITEPRAALAAACRSSSRVVVAGSMFLIGPLRGILR
jgi:dihydrofolate synthase/folylpolyglutamate synthase